jgi:hypothetical protein
VLLYGEQDLDFVFDPEVVPAGTESEPRFRVTFTDDNDVRWQLDAQQRLTEVPPAAEPESEPESEVSAEPVKRRWKRLLFWQ